MTNAISKALRTTAAAALLSLTVAGTASAYVGDAFLQFPDIAGNWKGEQYKNWVETKTQYWKVDDTGGISVGRRNNLRRPRVIYSGPFAPREGADEFMVAIDKHNPALPKLMEACAKKTTFAEVTYAENSARNRGLSEMGPKPADVPDYYEYKLKDVVLSDCPVVADAPEQAFVVDFKNIEWLNFKPDSDKDYRALTLQPATLKTLKSSGTTKSFVVTWFAVAHDVADDQCPVMSPKPGEAEYYALMSKALADKERVANKEKGISFENGQMARRGPHQLNACLLPGTVKDPGHVSPQTKAARGINLDSNDGTGAASAGTCKHKNYVSADGRQSGIDNQLYTVMGCMPGYMGHKGFLMQYLNEQRKNGGLAMLVQVSGIDNDQNDDSVDVTILYSLDHMAKNGAGTQVLPDYTFRLTNKPEFTSLFTQLHGKIVDGVIQTDPVENLQINEGRSNVFLQKAALRLQVGADGAMKGVVAGYQDWHRVMERNVDSNSENLYGFQCPAMYHALKEAADGLKDPVTGECNGISSAFDIEGVPAFIPPGQFKTLVAEAATASQATH